MCSPHLGTLGVWRGAALYVGALIGPGVLLVPSLAADAAGPVSIVAFAGLLILSAPLAITFAALAVRHPVAGGVSAYVGEGLGPGAAAVTGAWFLGAVFPGAPAVSLIGGYYVADLTGSGTAVAAALAADGGLPRWLAGGAPRSVPRRPLALIAAGGTLMLGALLTGFWSTGALVRSTSACFVAVYLLSLVSAVLILDGRARAIAAVALALVGVVAIFTSLFLLVPALIALGALALRR